MSADARERFVDLDGEAFARLVARTWRRYGWDAAVAEPADLPEGVNDPAAPIEDGGVVVARSAERPVVLVVSGAAPVSATALLGVLSLVDSPEELLVVAAAGFEGGAVSVADAYGLALVGPAAMARLRDSRAGANRIVD